MVQLLLLPLYAARATRAMKIKSAVKRLCEHCYMVRRGKTLYVRCTKNPRHKQRQGFATDATRRPAAAPRLALAADARRLGPAARPCGARRPRGAPGAAIREGKITCSLYSRGREEGDLDRLYMLFLCDGCLVGTDGMCAASGLVGRVCSMTVERGAQVS